MNKLTEKEAQTFGFSSKKRTKTPTKPVERKIMGFNLKNILKDQSIHSSVMMSERNSSMRNVVDTTYNQSQVSLSISQSSFRFGTEPKLNKSASLRKSQKKLDPIRGSQKKEELNIAQSQERKVENLFEEYYETNFIQSLLNFINKDWKGEERKLLDEKRFEGLRNLIVQKINYNSQLTEQFLNIQYDKYKEKDRKLMLSLLFKQNIQILRGYQTIFSEILRKIPEDKLLKQENQLQQIQEKLLEMFDVKFLPSNKSLKERYDLFIDNYTQKKNNLIVGIATKLKYNLNFVVEMEKYLNAYQKQVIKIRNQLQVAETEKRSLNEMLKRKVNFTPLEIDLVRLKELKDQSKKQFFDDLENNYISFHTKQHKKSDQKIQVLIKENESLTAEIQTTKAKLKQLQDQLQFIKDSVPKKTDAETQVFMIGSKGAIQQLSALSKIGKFLENVSSPFQFTDKITSSLINLLSIDKILHDYELIRNKRALKPFQDFMLQWFVVRTGSKKIAQIFTKNFMFSVKQLKGRHKRFNIFSKLCGFNGFRKKNLQQDLEYIFFQTHKAWYYLIKLAMAYRKKLNENPTGYHLFPPLQCENIFKIPLRKVYEIVDDFFENEQIQKPSDLHNQIDHYAINEISKYKSHDQNFQKQTLQEIHILREINFDTIAGFVIEYIAQKKCSVLQKFLRSVTLKQKQMKEVLGYSEFETIYRKYYKEKRSKIEQTYSNMCVTNQYDMLDIQNTESIIKSILQDERYLRSSFEKIDSLKLLVLAEKAVIKTEKRVQDINSYENFRQRYYYEFYDFFNATCFVQQIYRIIKSRIKKRLKNQIKNEEQIQSLIAEKQPIVVGNENKEKSQQKQPSESSEDDYSEDSSSEKEEKSLSEKDKKRGDLENKVNEWGKISMRIPHFSSKILTIDQIIIHNMRRKEMIEATEFAWKILRQILILIAKN